MKTNSKRGTNSTNQSKALSPQAICSIIRECKKAGVTHISYEELVVDFNPKPKEDSPQATSIPQERFMPKVATTEQEKIRRDEEAMAELMLTDPARYEQVVEEQAANDA